MGERKPRDLHDADDLWWSNAEAIAHFGIHPKTLERYFREGLPQYFKQLGGYVKREEILDHRRDRIKRNVATRGKKDPA